MCLDLKFLLIAPATSLDRGKQPRSSRRGFDHVDEARLLDFVAAVRLVGLKPDWLDWLSVGAKPAHRRVRGASDQAINQRALDSPSKTIRAAVRIAPSPPWQQALV
jgi:hypothetical protein